MLSVLIPVYNYDVTELVNELHKQLTTSEVDFELKIFDDGSKSDINKVNHKLNQLENVQFKELPKNVGLSNNRNYLASSSQYNYLLFLDGDSLITNTNFITNYLGNISSNLDILYGGRIHPEFVKSKNQKLRWKYGRFIEDKSAKKRSGNTYKTLMFNNTLIKKECFNTILFESSLTEYGHEDTLFAYQAYLHNLKVLHIDNPVLHGDIDENYVFISKTEKGIKNLLSIYNSQKIDVQFVKVLVYFKKLEKFKLKFLFATLFTLSQRLMKSQLNSSNPSLFLFNLYKLCYMCFYDTNKRKKH